LPVRKHSVPDRLQDNIDSGYAVTLDWEDIDNYLGNAVEQAYFNRWSNNHLIDNRREQMTKNYWF
jgi:adenosine deaminase